MPADFLKTATAHHLRATLVTFGEGTLRAGGTYLWLPAERNGTAYTLPILCAIARPRRSTRPYDPSGLPETPHENNLALHCDLNDLPFLPDPADLNPCCLIAPAIDGETHEEPLLPDPDLQRKYKITLCQSPLPGTTALRLELTLHD